MLQHTYIYIARLWAALLFLAGGLALPAFGQTNSLPETSAEADSDADHWYFIRFQRTKDTNEANRYLVIGNAATEGNVLKAKTLAQTGNDDQLWKLIPTGTDGQYYLKNKAGLYMGWNGSRYTSVAQANRIAIDLRDSHQTNSSGGIYVFRHWSKHRFGYVSIL